MPIECNQISNTVNYLLNAFQDCTKLKAEDMQKLVELIAAVNNCNNGGIAYNTLVSESHDAITEDLNINYAANTFHAITIVAVRGNIVYDNVEIPQGASINLEFTNLNQFELDFIVPLGSKALVNYIIQTT